MNWISVKEKQHPDKPDKESYEHVYCLVFVPRYGQMILAWNCEHLCWDSEDGDDVSRYNEQVTYWMELPINPS